jgi:hypothetical protein
MRDYFPNGTDLRLHSAEHLLAVENELNNRPRRILEDRSPATLFEDTATVAPSVRVATLTRNHPGSTAQLSAVIGSDTRD